MATASIQSPSETNRETAPSAVLSLSDSERTQSVIAQASKVVDAFCLHRAGVGHMKDQPDAIGLYGELGQLERLLDTETQAYRLGNAVYHAGEFAKALGDLNGAIDAESAEKLKGLEDQIRDFLDEARYEGVEYEADAEDAAEAEGPEAADDRDDGDAAITEHHHAINEALSAVRTISAMACSLIGGPIDDEHREAFYGAIRRDAERAIEALDSSAVW